MTCDAFVTLRGRRRSRRALGPSGKTALVLSGFVGAFYFVAENALYECRDRLGHERLGIQRVTYIEVCSSKLFHTQASRAMTAGEGGTTSCLLFLAFIGPIPVLLKTEKHYIHS